MLFMQGRKRVPSTEVPDAVGKPMDFGSNRDTCGASCEQRATLNVGVWVVPMDEAAPAIMQAFVGPRPRT